MITPKAVQIESLSFKYENAHTTLEDISLNVDQGDFLAIIGPNGGGKSTLLKAIIGQIRPQKGTVRIFDLPPQKARSYIGYVPQNTDINPHFPIRVIEVVMSSAPIKELFAYKFTKAQTNRAKEVLNAVGMHHYAERKIGDLSGGQRQRVMIARALYNNPKLLILDEPTANIDPSAQKEIYELLKQLNRSSTILVVSHDLSIILNYANKVAYVNRHLSFHDISDKKAVFHTHEHNERHFCEVELLQMLGSQNCHICNEEKTDG